MSFSADSKVGDVLDDPIASKVLIKYLPNLPTSPMLAMARGFSLSMVASFPQSNLSQEKLQAFVAELQAL